jgi:hypothetical protein
MGFYWKNIDIELFMMLKVMWRQSYLLLFVMVISFGDLLGLMPWWKFSPSLLKFDLVLEINLSGLFLKKEFFLVLILGGL